MYQYPYLRTEKWHVERSKRIATPSQTNSRLPYWARPPPHNSCCCLNPQRMYIVKIRVRLSETTRVGLWTNRIGFFVRRGTQSSLSLSPSPQALRKRHAEPPASQDAPSPETSLASTLTWDSSLQNYGQIPVVLAIHPAYGIWLWQFKLVYIGTKCKLLNSFFKSLLTLPVIVCIFSHHFTAGPTGCFFPIYDIQTQTLRKKMEEYLKNL